MIARGDQLEQIYPIVEKTSLLLSLPAKFRIAPPAHCPVCNRITFLRPFKKNVRESGSCIFCGATNRNRQLAYTLRLFLFHQYRHRHGRLASLVDRCGVRIYNTEAQGPLHQALSASNTYVCSEYLGEGRTSGEVVEGVLHQDLRALSFLEEEFDVVLSSDVLEHVPEPYKAHKEIYRVLRNGGRHIFTVPFLSDRYFDERTAIVGEDGKIVHLRPPEFHGDPLRPEGVLVYTLFSLEMLIRLAEVGFRTVIYSLARPRYGIFPPGSLVFEATKIPK